MAFAIEATPASRTINLSEHQKYAPAYASPDAAHRSINRRISASVKTVALHSLPSASRTQTSTFLRVRSPQPSRA